MHAKDPTKESYFEALREAVLDNVFHIGEDGMFISAWPNKDKPDLPFHTLSGKPLEAVVAPEAAEFLRSAMADAKHSGRSVDLQYQMDCPGGHALMRTRVSPAEDGSFFVVVRNITTETETRVSAEAGDQLRRLLLEAIPDPVFHLDEHGNYLAYTCQSTSDLYVEPELFVGKNVADVFPEEIARLNLHSITRALQTSEIQSFVYRSPVRDRFYEVRVVPAPNREVVMLLRDITVSKRVETELDARVRARTAELETANRELEAFCYSASHDLRAPLRSINGFSRLLDEDFGDHLPEEARDYIGRVRRATMRMDSIIGDMLRLAGVVRAPMNFKDVSLTELAKSCWEDVLGHDPDRIINFEVEPDLFASCDEDLMRIAMFNLLQNAYKFTGATVGPSIVVGRDKESYFVRDNGLGFDPEFSVRMFQPFERLHPTEEIPGNGIGLATVRRVIERHGGRIWAVGATGKGATFRFIVP